MKLLTKPFDELVTKINDHRNLSVVYASEEVHHIDIENERGKLFPPRLGDSLIELGWVITGVDVEPSEMGDLRIYVHELDFEPVDTYRPIPKVE